MGEKMSKLQSIVYLQSLEKDQLVELIVTGKLTLRLQAEDVKIREKKAKNEPANRTKECIVCGKTFAFQRATKLCCSLRCYRILKRSTSPKD